MDFSALQKTWVKVNAINMVKNFLIVLKNLQQMQQKQHQKGQLKKQQKQLVI